MKIDANDRAARRELLRRLVATGALGAAGVSGWISQALAAGTVSGLEGVNRLEGTATVNGRPAKVGTPVKPGDRVATGKASQAVVVIGNDAFLLRGETTIEYAADKGALAGMGILAGKVLSVFGPRPKTFAIKAATASIGIRGTGAYLEVEPARVYFCLCYGDAVIDGPQMAPKAVKTTHHEQPLYLLNDGQALRAEPGPFLNHADEELVLLESLVGREPPFVKDGQYPLKKY